MSIESEVIVVDGFIKMPYNWSAGETASHFLAQLRDHKKIWATKCPSCSTVFIPPRKNCFKCFVPIGDWMEVSSVGTLVTFTVVNYHEPDLHPSHSPLIYGIIKLDGADTGLLHLVSDVDTENLCSGMRVEAVFSQDRKGSPLDIRYFTPVKK